MREIIEIAGGFGTATDTAQSAVTVAARVLKLSRNRAFDFWLLRADAWAHEADHLREWRRMHEERQARRLQARTGIIQTLAEARVRYDAGTPAPEPATVDRRVAQAPYAGADRRKP